jgi:hypothetical protein
VGLILTKDSIMRISILLHWSSRLRVLSDFLTPHSFSVTFCVIVVYYESRKRELKIRLMNEGRCDVRRLMNEGRCDVRLKLELRNLHTSQTLGCTTKQTRNT